MWEAVVYFRWAEVEGSPTYVKTFDRQRQARSAAQIWIREGLEIEREDGVGSFVPAGSIHYVQVQGV